MTTTGVSDALAVLTGEEPSYDELVDHYNELRTSRSRTPETTVSRRALADVLGEFIDYLDFVEAELEKSVGLSRATERERILASLEAPHGETDIERVHRFVHQWDAVERYSVSDIAADVSE